MFPPPQPPPSSSPPPPPPPSTVAARQLSLTKSLPPTPITTFLFDPTSHSLALSHSDSSFSLYPSLPSPLSLSTFPPPQTLISPPSSSAAFLHLITAAATNPTSIFLVSSPTLGGSAVLLRFYLLKPSTKSFTKAKIICNHRDFSFDEYSYGVVFRVSHGVSVKLLGSTNVFTMYSVSKARIWVFAVKLVENEVLKLMKCAVIDCFKPVYSISVSLGYLVLGEENGVRVFPLRPLVKGRGKKERKLSKKDLDIEKDKKISIQNGVIHGINGVDAAVVTKYGNKNGVSVASLNGQLELRREKRSDPVRLTSLKLRQDTKEFGVCFVALKSKDIELSKSTKATCIRALSPKKFLILDSVGDLHFLCLSNLVHGSEISHNMQKLTHDLKIQKLAVFPDPSSRTQNVWVSDGHHTIHVLEVSEVDTSGGESDRKDTDEQLIETSVVQAIFTGEKIQEVVAFAPNATLILGAGNIVDTELMKNTIVEDPVKWLSAEFLKRGQYGDVSTTQTASATRLLCGDGSLFLWQ